MHSALNEQYSQERGFEGACTGDGKAESNLHHDSFSFHPLVALFVEALH
jgi:hypothetical protein